jgi:hypothetical protein
MDQVGRLCRADTEKAGKVSQANFATRIVPITPDQSSKSAARPRQRPPDPSLIKDSAIGGWFKFHWLDPQKITVKIDDKSSPDEDVQRSGFRRQRRDVYVQSTRSRARTSTS